MTSPRFIKALIQLLCTAVSMGIRRGWGKSLSMRLIKARHQRSLWSKSAMRSLRICLTFQPVERDLSRKREKKSYINTEQLFEVNVITLHYSLLSKLFNGGWLGCWLVFVASVVLNLLYSYFISAPLNLIWLWIWITSVFYIIKAKKILLDSRIFKDVGECIGINIVLAS